MNDRAKEIVPSPHIEDLYRFVPIWKERIVAKERFCHLLTPRCANLHFLAEKCPSSLDAKKLRVVKNTKESGGRGTERSPKNNGSHSRNAPDSVIFPFPQRGDDYTK